MIYLDNGATTYPKPEPVRRAIGEALRRYGANSGRSGFQMSMKTAEKIFECRTQLAEMFGVSSPEKVAFTLNCTQSLNMAIKGLVRDGDHVIISNLEHNAVMRPVETLAQRGNITYSVAKYDSDPDRTVANFASKIKANTRLIVCMHASNVFGTLFPIRELGRLARKNGIFFIVDAAQSAGIVPLNMERDCIDVLCMPGHKGLYGPMGTGVIIVNTEETLQTILEGGTGSQSSNYMQPDFLPDRLESGTLNTPGILGLLAGVKYVRTLGYEKIKRHEYRLITYAYHYLEQNPAVQLYCPAPKEESILPLLSFNYREFPSEKTAALLNEKGIAVRAGYHCAYTAHLAFGTQERGTVRLAPSVFTTPMEIRQLANVLKKL